MSRNIAQPRIYFVLQFRETFYGRMKNCRALITDRVPATRDQAHHEGDNIARVILCSKNLDAPKALPIMLASKSFQGSWRQHSSQTFRFHFGATHFLCLQLHVSQVFPFLLFRFPCNVSLSVNRSVFCKGGMERNDM